MKGKVVQVGDVYPSRYGGVEVIGRLKNTDKAVCKFLNTDNVREINKKMLKSGKAIDREYVNSHKEYVKNLTKLNKEVEQALLELIFKSKIDKIEKVTTNGYKFDVIECSVGKDYIKVKYDIDGRFDKFLLKDIADGKITRPSKRVSGGIFDLAGKSKDYGKVYDIWNGIHSRIEAYNGCTLYSDVKVSEDWKSFYNFKKWYEGKVDNYHKHGYSNFVLCVEKDFLQEGLSEKIYSEGACDLLPSLLNSIMRDYRSGQKYLIGVAKDVKPSGVFFKSRFKTLEGLKKWSPCFKSELECHQWFQHEMSNNLLDICNKLYFIDPRVIDRLNTASLKLMMDLSSGKITEDLWVYNTDT